MKRNQHRIEITLSDERLRALDDARGNEPRASFIKRATDELIMREPLPVPIPGEWIGPASTVHPNVGAKPAVKPRPKRGKR